jgi:hypothetical protein
MAGIAAWPKLDGTGAAARPPDVLPYFGRRSGWDAAAEHPAAGRCGVCGHPGGADPITATEGKIHICMGCMRAPAGVVLPGRRHAADPRRPAARAAKARGKPDPRLNAYLPPAATRKPKGGAKVKAKPKVLAAGS